jgi:excisionase family DNA binding protein
LTGTINRAERTLTVRPALSRAAVRFIETHPNELERIVANALETPAALDATGAPAASRSLPPALQGLISSSCLDSDGRRVLSISEAAERLKVTRVTVYAWIESKRLLAWRATRRGVLIPAEQIIGPGEVLSEIELVLAIISDPAAAWDFLTEESPYVNADALRHPIDALKAGEIDAVVAAAHSFLDAFT